MVRSTKGRQKIEMKKMKNESNLQVTFSKRSFGLFKKASELCTLCGAEILMIVFSPGGKVFSFGHPSVQDLIHRFENPNYNSIIVHQQNNSTYLVFSQNERISLQVLTTQEKEKNKRMVLDIMKESREQRGNWYEKDVKDLDMNETNHLISALQDVKKKLVSEMSQQYSQVNVSQNYFGQSSGFIGGPNVDVGIDLFDQRRNTFNYNPNMAVFPNHTPMFGYNNDGVIVPISNMNYMSSYNFNQS
ncbi:agamous-like MADS-box protein AGL62 [Arabidopsis lyrata subsp. lyrata]|uniref:agamous-like MADS-box protein AGL62 n=1 Tax=Arabidopsis lyrata subsp. lyrata TaxID=81972 RepID=UPI000A29D917|nr:agamous-like MADS-box protein AGL62 [Arabidopsis lyrata subsp. lyrata]|eukprot:XP_020875559.1 agamous-like MADS-box protein AGL62 [Arabidopsis lyrata subsp. lyrata]